MLKLSLFVPFLSILHWVSIDILISSHSYLVTIVLCPSRWVLFKTCQKAFKFSKSLVISSQSHQMGPFHENLLIRRCFTRFKRIFNNSVPRLRFSCLRRLLKTRHLDFRTELKDLYFGPIRVDVHYFCNDF